MKMGFLSDPEAGQSKWAHILVKYHRPFCFLLCISGYIWFCLLAHKSFSNADRIREDGLLPGLARSEFVDDGTAKRFLQDFQEEVIENYATQDSMPVPWLAARMRQLNLDVYTHNFTLNFPLGKGQVFHGENVYGILRAGRSASIDSLVISVPYRPLSSHLKSTNAGIAMMLAMAKFAKTRNYWAKDLIFLVTAHEQLGAQAWLQAYHDTGGPSPYWLDAGQLEGRAGAIQAAINLEMSSLKFNSMEVKFEGLNGQVPNMDLVTLVYQMCMQAGVHVHHAYKNSFSWIPKYGMGRNYRDSLRTLLSMVTTQATGVPTGNHGLFHGYGIGAVTLMSIEETGGSGRPAHVLEALLRSLNNFYKFYRGYFLYLRTSTDRSVSIGQYILPLIVLCGALFIRAFAVWLISQKQAINQKTKEQDDKNESKDDGEKINETDEQKSEASVDDKGCGDEVHEKIGSEEASQVASVDGIINHLSLLNVLLVFLVVHGIGYLVMLSPQLISEIVLEHFSLPTEEAIFYGLCVISAGLIVLLPPVLRKMLHTGDGNQGIRDTTIKLLMIMSLLELGTLMLCVGMLNFSLGFCMAAIYSPITLLISSGNRKKSRLLSWLCKLLWFLLHPLMVTLLVVYAYTGATFPEESVSVLMSRGLGASQQAIMFLIVDGMIYGNWLFNIVTAILFPSWLLFWQILNS